MLHGTGLNDDFTRDLLYRMRFFEEYGYFGTDERALRKIGALSLMTVYDIASGYAPDPYHYVDDVCYKVEMIGASEHPRWGEEQIYRVLVNETGEEVGRALYYPEYEDIAILEE